jgi:hypothetical protein
MRPFIRYSVLTHGSPVPSPLSVSGIPFVPETYSKEQAHPVDRQPPPFDSRSADTFLNTCDLPLKILKDFTQGKIPSDEKSLSKIAMYTLQHEPNVFRWLIEPESRVPSLSFASCEMDDEQATNLAKLLQGNKGLTSLNLCGNNISAKGAKEIAQVLPSTALTSLNLESNNIGDEGASAIAEALPDTVLISLDLRWNTINIGGATAIAKALKNNGTITALHVSELDSPQGENSAAMREIDDKLEENRSRQNGKKKNTLQQLSAIFTDNTQMRSNMQTERPEVTQKTLNDQSHKDPVNMQSTDRFDPIDNDDIFIDPLDANTTETYSIDNDDMLLEPLDENTVETYSIDIEDMLIEPLDANTIETYSIDNDDLLAEPLDINTPETDPIDNEDMLLEPSDIDTIETDSIDNDDMLAESLNTNSTKTHPIGNDGALSKVPDTNTTKT